LQATLHGRSPGPHRSTPRWLCAFQGGAWLHRRGSKRPRTPCRAAASLGVRRGWTFPLAALPRRGQRHGAGPDGAEGDERQGRTCVGGRAGEGVRRRGASGVGLTLDTTFGDCDGRVVGSRREGRRAIVVTAVPIGVDRNDIGGIGGDALWRRPCTSCACRPRARRSGRNADEPSFRGRSSPRDMTCGAPTRSDVSLPATIGRWLPTGRSRSESRLERP
jgi:hypothetical protein